MGIETTGTSVRARTGLDVYLLPQGRAHSRCQLVLAARRNRPGDAFCRHHKIHRGSIIVVAGLGPTRRLFGDGEADESLQLPAFNNDAHDVIGGSGCAGSGGHVCAWLWGLGVAWLEVRYWCRVRWRFVVLALEGSDGKGACNTERYTCADGDELL